jgi:hypothetical protein
LEILRQAIETRKTALVEVALDLIQRLIAHQALQVTAAVHALSLVELLECSRRRPRSNVHNNMLLGVS